MKRRENRASKPLHDESNDRQGELRRKGRGKAIVLELMPDSAATSIERQAFRQTSCMHSPRVESAAVRATFYCVGPSRSSPATGGEPADSY